MGLATVFAVNGSHSLKLATDFIDGAPEAPILVTLMRGDAMEIPAAESLPAVSDSIGAVSVPCNM